MYANGLGVRQDDAEAVRWYRLAADQGDASGHFNLGMMYANGLGVPQDDVEAARWWRLAADQGVAEAQSNLRVVEARMTAEQIAESQRRAREWTPTPER